MITFKEFNEMAVDTGHNSPRSKEDEWLFYSSDKGKKFISLFKDKLGKDHLKIFRTNDDQKYFLIDESNKYLGHIFGQVKDKVFTIQESSSNIKKGFYNIMFRVILIENKEILSDSSLSSQAIKSYSKLTKDYKIQIRDKMFSDEYFEFNKDTLMKPNLVVSVMNEHLEGTLEEYYRRISSVQLNEDPKSKGVFYLDYINKKDNLDRYLYCEVIQV